jgi:hypothetical protein
MTTLGDGYAMSTLYVCIISFTLTFVVPTLLATFEAHTTHGSRPDRIADIIVRNGNWVLVWVPAVFGFALYVALHVYDNSWIKGSIFLIAYTVSTGGCYSFGHSRQTAPRRP